MDMSNPQPSSLILPRSEYPEGACSSTSRAQPTLVYCPHPLLAAANRRIEYSTFYKGESIAAYLERLNIRLGSQPVFLRLNDQLIPRSEWVLTFPKQGDLLTIRARVRGGGGGEKNPLRTVLTIAVMIAAPYAAGFVQTGVWAAATGITGSLLTGVISIGGMMLVNAIAPLPAPNLTQASGRLDNSSPTYSLSGGSNRARPFEPLPLVLGQHRMFPDLGAKPYTEFEGDDQYLYQVFHFGLSDMVLSDFRIGNTPTASYQDVTIEESGADGALTLFPANVDSLAGAVLDYGADYTVRTSSADTTALAVELTGSLFNGATGDGSIIGTTCALEIEYRTVGSGAWLPFVGGSSSVTLSNASRKPLRITYWLAVAAGQYEVRLKRTTVVDASPLVVREITWSQLRSYQPDTADYTGQKRIAIKIKASGQLQGALEQFNAIASARCEAWNGSAWVLAETSNPAWWWRWFAKGKAIGSRRVFGCGLADARIDDAAVKAFGAWCDAKGLTFNAVVDRPMNCLDVLNATARCGRGSTTMATGKYGVTWDAPNQPVAAVFGMGNINLDTFQCEWITEKLGDEIELAFYNPDLDWQQDTVRAKVPGVTDPVNPVRVELFGCTNNAMAGPEANLIAAAQKFRRRFVSFECDFEGMVASRGDVVMVSHELFAMGQLNAWGYSGRLVAGTANELTLDAMVPFTPATPHYVAVRYPDSSLAIRPVNLDTGEKDVIGLTTALPSAPDTDPNGHPPCDYLWFFGLDAAGPAKKMKVHEIGIVSEDTVRLILVDENPDYYAAESNTFVYTPPGQFTAPLPVISNLQLTEDLMKTGNGFAVKLTLTWDVAGTYDHANVRLGANGAALQGAGSTPARRMDLIVSDEGSVDVEVTAMHPLFGAGPASVATAHYVIVGKAAPPSDVTGFNAQVDGADTLLRWTEIADVDRDDYEIRQGADFETGAAVGRTKANTLRVAALAAPTTFWIKAFDTSRNPSVNAVSLTVTPVAPPALALSAVFDGADVKLTWPTPVGGSYPIKHYAIRHGATWAGGTPVGFVDVTTFRALAEWSGERAWWVVAIDVGGNESPPVSVGVVVTPPSQPTILPEVIDNNVLLRWTDARQTLPLRHYEVRRGNVFATATVIGTISAQFSVVFESAAGTYRYWVVGVDAAGNYGTEGSVTTSVAAPPDYVLFDNIVSDFSGTKTNTLVVDGRLLASVDPTRTYEQHFTDEGWDQPQDQIDAGFPIFIEPGKATAQYVEQIDYGTVLPATNVTVDLGTTIVAGATTITPTISVRKLATDPWTDYAGVWSVYATDFQFISIALDFASAGRDDLLFVDTLNVRLDVKLKSDAGSITANSGDAGGTQVFFNVDFIDIRSLGANPRGTAARYTVVDFTDVPHPTSFKILCFDSAGNRVTSDVYWNAKGA